MLTLSAVRRGVVCAAIAAGVLGTAAIAHAQSTVLVLDGQPGNYIAGQRTYTPAEVSFGVRRTYNNGVSVFVSGTDYQDTWSLDFGAGSNTPLAVGSYYGARRFPFTSFNGLDVSGSGRGCNELTGRFDIREVVYAADGTVLRFAADFEQHCENVAPALFGAIRYKSTIVDAVPFEGHYPAYDLTMSPAAGGVVIGENINCGNTGTACAIRFPAASFEPLRAIPAPGYQLLGWIGDCTGGNVTVVMVHGSTWCAPVFGLDTPPSFRNGLMLDSQTDDYIGGGAQQRYTDSTSLWSAWTLDGGNLLRMSVDGADGSWNYLAFRAPGGYGVRLVPGEYTGAIHASSSSPAPGLEVSGNGRGCGTVAGRFTVYESVYNADGTIARFAADFEQHCGGFAPALFGSVRFNSSASGVLPFGGAYPSFRITISPPAHGRIYGGDIDCEASSGRCTMTRSTAGPLTLTATPASGYAFVEWTGDCSGRSASTTVDVDTASKYCAARFSRTLADMQQPVFSRLPSDQHVLTSRAAGTRVTWMPPIAVDAVDGPVAVLCAPASGTMFPVGDTAVSCTATDRTGNQATAGFGVTVTRRALGIDLNGDDQADLLWRGANGEVAVWMMSGQARASTAYLATISTDWRIAAVGDFTGDGQADFVWQQNTGTVVLWEMHGTSHMANHVLYAGYTTWRVEAAGDLNGDGQVDLIWQGPNGSVAAWMMRGLATDSVQFLYDAVTPWRVVAAVDLDGDGVVDLIWQSPAGAVAAWLMNGLARREVVWLFSGDTDWRVEGIANLNGDNSVDLVWQSPSGTVFAWLMNGVERVSVLPLYQDTDWRITGPR
jgi:hypothetical protein